MDVRASLHRAHLAGTLLVLTSAVGFGVAGTISRLAADAGLGTIGFITWRAAIAAVAVAVLAVPLLAIGRLILPRRRQVARRDRLALTVVTSIAAVVNLAMFVAFSRVAIGVAMICFYTYPALVTIGAVHFYGEPVDRRRAAALLLGFCGLALVLLPSLTSVGGRPDLLGVGLALLASVFQAVNTLIMGRGFGAIPTPVTAFAMNAVSALVYFGLALVLGPAVASLAVSSPQGVMFVVFAGVATGAVPTLANVAGIRLLGSARAAILMMLEAVVGVSMAAILLAQRPEAIQLLGGLAVLLSGGILQLPKRASKVIAERLHPTV